MQKLFEIEFTGKIPSKKNSKRIFRGMLLSSKEYLAWEKEWVIRSRIATKLRNIGYSVKLEYIFNKLDERKFDMSNKIESVNDMLIKAGIIKDDNAWIISETTSKFTNEKSKILCILRVYEL